MSWIVALFVWLLLAALARLFFASARMIRRDINNRFDEFGRRLEKAANIVVDDLLDPRKRS